MFGYVMINKPELKMKDFELYQSYYCGLCHSLKKRYGQTGRVTLTYDMTFLAVLLSGLYEPAIRTQSFRCPVHPVKRRCMEKNEFLDYAADLNLFLAYQKMADDVRDDNKVTKKLGKTVLKKRYLRAKERIGEKAERMEALLEELAACEQANETNPDVVSGLFGELTACIFRWREDEWAEDLSQMGFFLGKFIYLLDAYEDLEEDKKTGSYNPLRAMAEDSGFEETIRQILILVMAECAKAFERLPILQNVDILRNIIYSGVWCRYNMVHQQRTQENEDEKGK